MLFVFLLTRCWGLRQSSGR